MMTAIGKAMSAYAKRGLSCALAWTLIACAKSEPPGELVGAYHIEGALIENSCGREALPAPDPLSFNVEVRKDDAGRGIWLRDMPPAHYGRLDADGEFQFELESNYPVDLSKSQSDPDGLLDPDADERALLDPERYDRLDRQSMRSCALIVAERIAGILLRDAQGGLASQDAGEPGRDSRSDTDDGSDLDGENVIAIRAAAGSHCEPVLSTYGGPFAALPCMARYDLAGELAQGR